MDRVELHRKLHRSGLAYLCEVFDQLLTAVGADAERGEPADDDELTRAELYELAQQLDIPGRSGMDRDELAAAIADAEGVTS